MQQARLHRAGTLIVVARILVQQRREDRVSQIIAAPSVRKLCRKALAVALRSLPVPGEGVVRLLDAGGEAYAKHRHGIECAARGERKFLFPGHWGGVRPTGCIEIW